MFEYLLEREGHSRLTGAAGVGTILKSTSSDIRRTSLSARASACRQPRRSGTEFSLAPRPTGKAQSFSAPDQAQSEVDLRIYTELAQFGFPVCMEIRTHGNTPNAQATW
jgi:hypothetical protein